MGKNKLLLTLSVLSLSILILICSFITSPKDARAEQPTRPWPTNTIDATFPKLVDTVNKYIVSESGKKTLYFNEIEYIDFCNFIQKCDNRGYLHNTLTDIEPIFVEISAFSQNFTYDIIYINDENISEYNVIISITPMEVEEVEIK